MLVKACSCVILVLVFVVSIQESCTNFILLQKYSYFSKKKKLTFRCFVTLTYYTCPTGINKITNSCKVESDLLKSKGEGLVEVWRGTRVYVVLREDREEEKLGQDRHVRGGLNNHRGQKVPL